MRPVCVPCKREYRIEKNEVAVEQLDNDRAFKLWSGDLWQCPSCEHQLVTGFGRGPLAESHQTERYNSYRSEIIVSLP
jgi:hypothetical protein